MYDFKQIEKKRQKYWDKNNTFEVKNNSSKQKFYVLDMFPYPSGAGLHVGHPKGYTANDIIARYKNAKGYNVLHPMGWDAFGLPAENYAIKTGTHPKITTKENIINFKKQIKSLGFSYDWKREIDTTDPKYYKWTQWIFIKMFELGLAYEQDLPINFCPNCKTSVANEEILNDYTHERCGTIVEKKKIRQWVLAITKYADRLEKDVDILDWPEGIKDMQKKWIGKSEGCEFEMKITQEKGELSSYSKLNIKVYTTRIDTVFGMTYVVIAPDHNLVYDFITSEQKEVCEKYIYNTKNKSDIDRVGTKEKTGVFTGSFVINPFNGEKIPVWIGDYVLGNYGTGAIMAVPAHDKRDFEFAKLKNIEIKPVILTGGNINSYYNKNFGEGDVLKFNNEWNDDYANDGILVNSGIFTGLKSSEAREKLIQYAEEKGFGKRKINYKLRDWLFSRQRYWGEPIPLIHILKSDLDKLDKIDNKKSENNYFIMKGVTHNGNTVKFSLSSENILENIIKVNKKNNKKLFGTLKYELNTKKGTIIFDGKKLIKNFSIKQRKEIYFRIKFGETIIKYIDEIFYENDLIGYIGIKNYVFKIILEKKDDKKYEIKTYYSAKKLSKIFNTAYIKQEEDGDYLYIKWQKFSKIYDGLYTKIVIDYNIPLKLPEVNKYEPSSDGQSPLARVSDFVNVKLADNLVGKRETNTMPQWGGSCWYYLRFMDDKNQDKLVGEDAEKYWLSVDSYVGGAEHAVLHLLYARFWHKFLYDIGIVSTIEPFMKLRNQGLILSYAYQNKNGGLIANDEVIEKDGNYFHVKTGERLVKIIAKMSKSLKNVVNPDDIINKYGADTLRLYEMYISDFKDSAPWNTENIVGISRFLEKVWNLFNKKGKSAEKDENSIKLLHKTIKKVGEDIENYKFNTAIAQLMILVNYGTPKDEKLSLKWKEIFVKLLHPFAPHIAEELWSILGHKESIFNSDWPEYDENLIKDDLVIIGIQILGKLRGELEININDSKEDIISKVKNIEGIKKWINGKEIIKEIYIPGKILNLIIK